MFNTIVLGCIFFGGLFSGGLCNCGSYFQTEPNDVIITEGQDAFFICKVSNVNRKTDSLTWVLNPNKYDILILQSPSTVNNEITSVLTVLNVGRTEQTHRCVLNFIDSNSTIKSCESKDARIFVQYFPREDEIECGPQISQTVYENEIQSVWCEVPRGHPIVNISWDIDENSHGVQVVSRRDEHTQDKVISVREINVSHLADSQLIECLVTVVSAGEHLSCTIGPLTVLYKPILRVSTSQMTIQLNNTRDDIKINCSGDGNPNVQKVSWTCIPPIESCSNKTGRTLTIRTDQLTLHDGIYVIATCSASNIVGASNATSVIDVLLARDSYGPDRPVTKAAVNNQNISLTLQKCDADDVPRDAINVNLVCIVHCIGCYGGETVKVRWHSNGKIVKEDEGTLGNESITFYFIAPIPTSERGNTVICDAMVHLNSSSQIYKGNVFIEMPNPKGKISLPKEMLAFGPSYSLTTISVSEQDNITDMKTLGNQFILFTAFGIAGSIFLTISLFVVGLVVMYRIIQAKAERNSDSAKENSLDSFPSIQNQISEGQKKNAVNSDSDYEEPLQSIDRRCSHHYSRPDDDPSHYEMKMLGTRFSMNSQGTSDTTSYDSFACCNTSDNHSSESYSPS